MSDFSLQGKNILITGASSGIGRQCAVSCRNSGANVIITGRNESRLNDTFSQLENGNHKKGCLDITNFSEIEPFVESVLSDGTKIHGFIHAAGIEKTVPLSGMKAEYYKEIFDINVTAGFEFARILSKKKYLAEPGASFVFIASILGVMGQPAVTGYSASKGAVIAGVKSLALELAPKKIRVNALSPGLVETEMFAEISKTMPEGSLKNLLAKYPLGIGKTSDVANACIYLLSDGSRWITGTNIILDGGYSSI